jgi:hypothetical protein
MLDNVGVFLSCSTLFGSDALWRWLMIPKKAKFLNEVQNKWTGG